LKALPTIAASAIALVLLVSPMMVTAAGSVTFSSPAAGASYKGTATVSIAGTISPAPTQADQIGLTVKNPSGQTVDIENAQVASGGFSASFVTGGSSSWISGTYTISALDSYGDSGSVSFIYTSSGIGQYNVTAALIKIQKQLNQTLAQNAVLQKDLKGNESAEATTLAGITSSLSGITSSLTGITSSLQTLTNNLNTVSTAVTGLQSSITNIGTQVGSINTAVQALGTQVSNAASQATTAANNASNVQTYVLVVAVLAAITLVLELAILVRKLS